MTLATVCKLPFLQLYPPPCLCQEATHSAQLCTGLPLRRGPLQRWMDPDQHHPRKNRPKGKGVWSQDVIAWRKVVLNVGQETLRHLLPIASSKYPESSYNRKRQHSFQAWPKTDYCYVYNLGSSSFPEGSLGNLKYETLTFQSLPHQRPNTLPLTRGYSQLAPLCLM